MIISKVTTIWYSRGDYFWIKLNLFIFFAVKFFFFLHSRCSRQFVPDWKYCLGYIWANRNNRLCILGLGNIFWPFFFEFSKVNILKINLTKIVLIYASVNHIRIFHRLFLIYAPVKHIRILQCQFDDASCFQCTKLHEANISYKEQKFYLHWKTIKCI